MSRSPDQSNRWASDRRPLALRADDFEAVRPPRASADLRRRIDAWALGVVARLAELGVGAAAASGEGDWAQVHFGIGGKVDPEATRLVLRIEPTGVRAGLELPATRARAARMRLTDPARALELSAALEALPEQFAIGESNHPATIEAPRTTADDLWALLDRLEGGRGIVWIGWTVPRDLALEHAAVLDEQLEDALAALAQLFVLLVGDASEGVNSDTSAHREGRRFSGRRDNGGSDGKGTRRKDEGDRDRGRDADSRARGRERERERDGGEGKRERVAEPEPSRETTAVGGRRLDVKLPPRPGSRRRPVKASQVAIERGARVSVLKGPFSGKVGVVHELDGKGGARVMLGLLAVRLEVTNLLPCVEGRGRPVLSSSHRKPIPARS